MDDFNIKLDYEQYNTTGDGDTWGIFQKMIEQYCSEGRLQPNEYAQIGCIWEVVQDYVKSTYL